MSVALDDVTAVQDVDLAPLEPLEALLDGIPAAKERAELGQALDQAYSQVTAHEGLAERLAELSAGFAVCVGYLDLPEEMQQDLGSIQSLGKRLSSVSSREDYAEVRHHVASLEREVTALERAVTQALHRLVRVEFSSTGALGRVLAQVEETRELGARMVTLGREAEGLVHCTGEQIATEVVRLRELRQSLRDELGGLGADEAVVSFLQDIARKGEIPLSKIQGTVLPWLEEHGAMNLFAVSLKV